jgi:hypothetical protein
MGGTMIKVVRLDNTPNYTLYIGRAFAGFPASKWKNPFPEWKFGRKGCLVLYEEHVRSTPKLMAALHELDDQVLGCWCKPLACHGDILVKLRKEQLESIH